MRVASRSSFLKRVRDLSGTNNRTTHSVSIRFSHSLNSFAEDELRRRKIDLSIGQGTDSDSEIIGDYRFYRKRVDLTLPCFFYEISYNSDVEEMRNQICRSRTSALRLHAVLIEQ